MDEKAQAVTYPTREERLQTLQTRPGTPPGQFQQSINLKILQLESEIVELQEEHEWIGRDIQALQSTLTALRSMILRNCKPKPRQKRNPPGF